MKINLNLKYILYVVSGIILIVCVATIGSTIRVSNSDAYKVAKTYIISDTAVIKEFGEIKAFGTFPLGGLSMRNGIDYAQIETNVEGSKGEGKVVLLMEKKDGEWIVNEVYINP